MNRSATPFCQVLLNEVRIGDIHRSQRGRDDVAEDGVAIVDELLWCAVERERLAQLLRHPGRRWAAGDGAVDRLATSVADDDEDVEQAEGRRRNGEQVHRCERLSVRAKERGPRRSPRARSRQPGRNRETLRSDTAKPKRTSQWPRLVDVVLDACRFERTAW
jgi:hypothetical protein